MINLTFQKTQWINPLQLLSGAIDKKNLKPILSTILVTIENKKIFLTATDLEIQLTAFFEVAASIDNISFTLPGKKTLDLIRTLDDTDCFELKVDKQQVVISMSATRFKLASLPPETFPHLHYPKKIFETSFLRKALIELIQLTSFAISQQDVRIFLNGMLIVLEPNRTTAVAADGHRMAIATCSHELGNETAKLLIPRKSVFELLKLLTFVEDEQIQLEVFPGLLTIKTEHYLFSTKLIDAQFLPYHQAIPKHPLTFVLADKDALKKTLSRIMIIANDKSRPVILEAGEAKLSFLAQNQEQEQASESIDVSIDGPNIRLGINPYYLMDVLNIFEEGLVRLSFSSPDKSILVETLGKENYQYILMPMKI